MSKLNIDQSSIKKLFEDKKSDFLIPIIKDLMRGEKKSVKLYGMIFLNLHFQMTTKTNLTKMKNIT